MEEAKLNIAKIVGTPSQTSWAQIHAFFPEDREKLIRRGRLLAVIVLKTSEVGVETVALGREVLSRLHEEYFGNLEGGVLEQLKKALEKIKEEWDGAEITAGAILPTQEAEVLYVGILGRGSVLLQRKSVLKKLLSGEEVGQVKIGSGLLQPSDSLLFGSSSFFEIVSEGAIKASLALDSPQDIVESLAPMILGRSDLNQAAAVICRLEETLPAAETEMVFSEKEEIPAEEKNLKPSFWQIIKEKTNLLKNKFKLPKFHRSSILVRRQEGDQRKKTLMLISGILIFLLLASLILGLKKRQTLENESRANVLLSQAEEKYNQAREMVGLDDAGAVLLLKDAINLLNEADKFSRRQEIDFLFTQVNNLLNQSEKEKKIANLSIFFDLGLIKGQAKATAVSENNGQLAILDQANNSLYFLDLEKKSSWFFTEPRLGKSQAIFFTGTSVYLLSEEGVLEFKVEEKKLTLVLPKDKLWDNAISLISFSGNLYILDDGKKTIWQYLLQEKGFSAGKSWFTEDAGEFTGFFSWGIDGSIWLLDKNGKLWKYTRGKAEQFKVKGIKEDQLVGIKKLYTNSESEKIYLLDPQGKRIISLAKDGQLKVIYRWEGQPDDPSLFVVIENKKQTLLLQENSIFSLPLSD